MAVVNCLKQSIDEIGRNTRHKVRITCLTSIIGAMAKYFLASYNSSIVRRTRYTSRGDGTGKKSTDYLCSLRTVNNHLCVAIICFASHQYFMVFRRKREPVSKSILGGAEIGREQIQYIDNGIPIRLLNGARILLVCSSLFMLIKW